MPNTYIDRVLSCGHHVFLLLKSEDHIKIQLDGDLPISTPHDQYICIANKNNLYHLYLTFLPLRETWSQVL